VNEVVKRQLESPVREIRSRGLGWRGLETGRNQMTKPLRQSSTLLGEQNYTKMVYFLLSKYNTVRSDINISTDKEV
jgi:hypothetical protein